MVAYEASDGVGIARTQLVKSCKTASRDVSGGLLSFFSLVTLTLTKADPVMLKIISYIRISQGGILLIVLFLP